MSCTCILTEPKTQKKQHNFEMNSKSRLLFPASEKKKIYYLLNVFLTIQCCKKMSGKMGDAHVFLSDKRFSSSRNLSRSCFVSYRMFIKIVFVDVHG